MSPEMLDDWRFCPRCGGTLTAVEDHLRCAKCGERYWANSVPGVQALILRDGHVLLGRRRSDPGAGRWDLPGGFLHEGEAALDGLRREVIEETGLEIEPLEFVGTWNEPYGRRNVLCLTWYARPTGGTEQPGDDLVELGWFTSTDRPRHGELAFPTFEEILSLFDARDQHA
jgi:ADP-ribose pyrophosphatase YjhB (NUDIX family)